MIALTKDQRQRQATAYLRSLSMDVRRLYPGVGALEETVVRVLPSMDRFLDALARWVETGRESDLGDANFLAREVALAWRDSAIQATSRRTLLEV